MALHQDVGRTVAPLGLELVAEVTVRLDFETIPFISDADGAYDVIIRDNVTSEEYDAENRVFGESTHSAIITVGIQGFVVGEEIKRLRIVVVGIDRTAPNGSKARLYIVHGAGQTGRPRTLRGPVAVW